MNSHARVAVAPTLVKQTGVYTHDSKNTAHAKIPKSTPTSTLVNIFSMSSLFWNSHLTYRTLYVLIKPNLFLIIVK